MPKQYLQIKRWDGLVNSRNPRDIGFGLSKAQNVSIDKRGVIRAVGGLETHGQVPTQAAIIAPGYGLDVFDTDHKSGAAAKDTGENWLALADAVNGKVDLYNLTDDSFTASVIDLGTVTSYAPGAGKIDFPTTSRITDSDSSFITTGKIKTGDIVKISGCTTTTANNIVVVIHKAAEGILIVRGSPLTAEAAEAGTVTLTVLQTSVFHYVNEALRVASASGGAAMRPRHYGYTKRTHFPGLTDEEDAYDDWAASGPGPGTPTDLSVTAVDGDAAAGALTAGLGVEIGVAQNADKGEWPASPDPGTIDWEVAISRIYEHGQESALYIPATAQTFQTADNDSLDITVLAKTTGNSYGARVSGFRGYFRKEGSDDYWVLLVDIDMNKGARATLSGDYAAWLDGATANVVYTTAFDSFRQNVDITYESLTGINPETPHETFSGLNSFWRCSLVAKNRAFIASLKYTDKDGNLVHQRDSLFYSQPNAYDLYSIDNEITVTKGDAEEPVQLAFFNDRVLMFKQKTLYTINIASGNDGDWFLESKHKFRGVEHPGAVAETPHGIAWCNKFGVFLYTGSEIVELLKDKIEFSEHPLAYQRYYEFDGASGNIKIADAVTIKNIFADSASIEFEIYPKSDGENSIAQLINKEIGGTGWYVRFEGESGANLRLSFFHNFDGNDGTWRTGVTIPLNKWSHVIIGYDGSSVDNNPTMFVNGVAETLTETSTPTGTINSDSGRDLFIGNTVNDDRTIDGFIGMMRLWGSDVTASATILAAGAPSSAVGTPLLELLPKNIRDTVWIDAASGGNDGVVNSGAPSGTTSIFEDSWVKFYTNYSILGYHARANQLIIMRDCIGRWSRGQDYGDSWIIDLDTGFITTGRRVFTKGVAYSNFSVDWKQDLIIGEQSGANVIMKRWTDSPVSQAVGLIDVRTADFDMGNPAIKKIIDAFTATYKSSAAQTNPLSYALDCDDRKTAWTKLTGNLDPEGNWEKLVIEPESFNCDSIRLRISNPTSAGTIEINDVSLRHEEQFLKLE